MLLVGERGEKQNKETTHINKIHTSSLQERMGKDGGREREAHSFIHI
jgi:hypothetical protein